MQRDDRWQRVVRLSTPLAALAIGLLGILVAARAPARWFAWFRAVVVGTPDPLTEPFVLSGTQRLTAALGAALGGAALWRLAALDSDTAASPVPLKRHWSRVAALALAGVVLLNLRWAGVQLGLWGFWLPWLRHLYLPLVVAFTVAALAALGIRHLRTLDRRALALSSALGAAYGGFSALWHCCAPLWVTRSVPWPMAAPALLAWATAFASYVAGVSAPLRSPVAECAGATLFAVGYPWHTLLWFAQGLAGGVLSVRLTRRTGCAVSPGLFLACAYLTHTTLPFLA